MSLQVCKFHASDDVFGVVQDDGGEEFVCSRTDHPQPGPYRWVSIPPPPASLLDSGLTADLGLKIELPAALAPFKGRWVEYGVVEHAYASNRPDDFARLVEKYSHAAQFTFEERQAALKGAKGSRYTVSKFLARALSELGQRGDLLGRYGPATGAWKRLGRVSYWSFPPEPDWDERLTCESYDKGMGYVPGAVDA